MVACQSPLQLGSAAADCCRQAVSNSLCATVCLKQPVGRSASCVIDATCAMRVCDVSGATVLRLFWPVPAALTFVNHPAHCRL
jgi:hypothetical protein